MMIGYAASAVFGIFDLARSSGGRIEYCPPAGLGHRGLVVVIRCWFAPSRCIAGRHTPRDGRRVECATHKRCRLVGPNFGSLAAAYPPTAWLSCFAGWWAGCGINTKLVHRLSGATGVTSRSVGYAIGLGFLRACFHSARLPWRWRRWPLPVMALRCSSLPPFVFSPPADCR